METPARPTRRSVTFDQANDEPSRLGNHASHRSDMTGIAVLSHVAHTHLSDLGRQQPGQWVSPAKVFSGHGKGRALQAGCSALF